ncbi:MAG TPA: GAF domain-containing protein [Solirubrobacteraceae bacterium]|jgi:GAF domain-containing protein
MSDPGAAGELLRSTVQLAQATFGARAASIALHDPARDELVFAAVAGEGAGRLEGTRFPAGSGIAGWVFSARQPLVVEDVRRDSRFAEDVASGTGYVPHGLMAAPLLGDDEVARGVISVLDRPRRAEFSLIELDLLGLFAEQAARALTLGERATAARGGLPDEVVALADRLAGADAGRREAVEDLLAALARLI